MQIVDSLEMRWFLSTDSFTAAALDRWFAQTPSEPSRVDHYLSTGRSDLSVKARLVIGQPARVETKYLVGSLGLVEVLPAVTGALQRWRKLSVELDDPALQREGSWLTVEKDRRLRKYAVSMEPVAAAVEVVHTDRPPVGCNVELTKVHDSSSTDGRHEWTFGFEAFGPPSRLLEVFGTAVHTVGSALPELSSACTASYAKWLLLRGA